MRRLRTLRLLENSFRYFVVTGTIMERHNEPNKHGLRQSSKNPHCLTDASPYGALSNNDDPLR